MMTKKPKMLNAVQKPKFFSTEKRIARNKKAVARKTRKKDLTTSKRMELVNMLKKQLGKDGYNQIRKDARKVKLTRTQKSAINKINNYYDYEQSKEKSIAKRKKRITKLSSKPKMAMKKPKMNAGFDKLPKEVQQKITKNKKPKMAMSKKPKLTPKNLPFMFMKGPMMSDKKKPKMAAKKPKLTGVVKPRLTGQKKVTKKKITVNKKTGEIRAGKQSVKDVKNIKPTISSRDRNTNPKKYRDYLEELKKYNKLYKKAKAKKKN